MKPEEVPIELIEVAAKAAWATFDEDMGSEDFESATEEIREILAAVLPEHEKHVRERVAKEIEKVEAEEGDGSSWDGGMGRAASIARGGS